MDFKTPIAMAKSNIEPVFRILAGDKLITYFLLSKSISQFLMAVLTLSLDSLILISGRPTISQEGSP